MPNDDDEGISRDDDDNKSADLCCQTTRTHAHAAPTQQQLVHSTRAYARVHCEQLLHCEHAHTPKYKTTPNACIHTRTQYAPCQIHAGYTHDAERYKYKNMHADRTCAVRALVSPHIAIIPYTAANSLRPFVRQTLWATHRSDTIRASLLSRRPATTKSQRIQ